VNRGQIKRIRKEIDRLRNGGREWDALRVLSREAAVEEFRAEWDDIWRVLTRQSLRTAAGMEEFLARIREFDAPPETPDIAFLAIVGAYLEGKDLPASLDSIRGLSAPAETLRRELIRQEGSPPVITTKQRNLLMRFATTPEAVLQKDYRNQGSHFSAPPFPPAFAKACELLEKILSHSRRFNSVSAVKRGIQGVNEGDLGRTDAALNQVVPLVPPALFRVLVAPVLAQVSSAIGRIAAISPDQGARLALSAPFCLEMLAGHSWDDLRRKLPFESAHSLTDADRAALRTSARTASLEERLSLINRLSTLIMSRQEPDADLQKTLTILYRGIFKEIEKRREGLPEREQRNVVAVFGPVLEKHLELLYNDLKELPFLLDDAASAGCLTPALTLLQTFFAVSIRDRNMISHARSMLKLLPPIREKDVQKLFEEHQFLILDDLKGLKGMLDICRESGHDLHAFFAMGVGFSLLSRLLMNTLEDRSDQRGLLNIFFEQMAEETARQCNRLIKGMEIFAAQPEFVLPVQLARAFPAGRITAAEFGRLLENLFEAEPGIEKVMETLFLIVGMIVVVARKREMELPFVDGVEADILQREILTAALDVVCRDRERLSLFSTESLSRLVKLMEEFGSNRGTERYRLLIANVAATRVDTDESARALYNSLLDSIRKSSTKAGKGRRRR
jgi:hypothetical protein